MLPGPVAVEELAGSVERPGGRSMCALSYPVCAGDHVCATRLRGALTPDRTRAQSWAVKGAFVVTAHELIGE
jgi:hypothetical protein